MKILPRTIREIIESMDENLQKGRPIPVLILLYSTIDNVSYLTNETDEKGRSVFKKWVRRWMLTNYPLPCNEVDLYSARCGLLHKQSGESDLTSTGEAKQIWYTHGTAEYQILQATIVHIGQESMAVAVSIENLLTSFKSGLKDCLLELEKNPELKEMFEKKLDKVFGTIPSTL